jgi:hypothetical protein
VGKTLDKLKEELDKPLWLNRIAYYSLIFISVLGLFGIVLAVFCILIPDFSISNNPVFTQYNTTELSNKGFYDNERYLLSALVQSLAAVIALVITLSLVAVQLAAQSYSPRIIDVYKKNPDMWILLGIYIITIFYGLGLIKIVGLGILGSYMEGAIFAAYFMGFFAFVCLVPYMLKTLDLLKPSTVIKLLAGEITKKNILEFLEIDGQIDDRDPVQPVVDIINGAIERNDYETVRNGLESIKKSTIYLINQNSLETNSLGKIIAHVYEHLERMGQHAINNINDDSTTECSNSITEIAIKVAEMKDEEVVIKGQNILKNMCFQTVSLNRKAPTKYIVRNIVNLCLKTIEHEIFWPTTKTIRSLEEIGIKTKSRIMEDIVKELIKGFSDFASRAFEYEFDDGEGTEAEDIIFKTLKTLTELGTVFATKETEGITLWVVGAIKKIGLEATDRNLEEIVERTIISLKEFQATSIKNGLLVTDEVTKKAIEQIEKSEEDN